ncbi:hydroxyisourate hydrolase [Paenibacillus sp. Marseille-Q4541]|uniref:hydroxyisourate hydrolase n=1 Tax=Paenibacillus sp. Marseille-Q4541 TaxID=2831522 RepID=UPI001BA7B30B|nr:hydroxyisourate hydrolase [Paenibacillus sp. Marseille-Q4541]
MAGKLTTHVLDTSRGIPGSNMKVELYVIQEEHGLERAVLIDKGVTNTDGRMDTPFLEDQLIVGIYELRFYVGAYYETFLVKSGIRSIWDVIPLRFEIVNIDEHYHVPLLVAPGGYSTYRGS